MSASSTTANTCRRWPTTRAGAVIVHPDLADRVPPTAVAIVTDRALCRLGAGRGPVPSAAAGRARACIRPPWSAPDAAIDPSAEIGPLAVIGARRRDRPALPHRPARRHRRRRRARRRLPDRRACQRQPRPARRSRDRLSRRADRPGRLRLRRHRRRLPQRAAARPGGARGRRGDRRQHHDRPRLAARHA